MPEFDAVVALHPWKTAVKVLRLALYGRTLRLSFIGLLVSPLLSNGVACASPATPGAARRVELIRMVRNDCSSCHGIRLTGGLGLSLTPDALRGKPDSALVATILYGRPGTPMPPWEGFMSEPEAEWIVENLKLGFPNAESH